MNNAAKIETIRVQQLSDGKLFDATRLDDTPQGKGKQVLAVGIEGDVPSGQLYVVTKGRVIGSWEIVENGV